MTKEELLEDWNGLRQEIAAVETLLWRRFSFRPTGATVTPVQTAPSTTIETNAKEKKTPAISPVEGNGVHPTADSDLPYSELAREWVKTATGKVNIKTFRAWLQKKFPGKTINKSSLNAPMRRLVESGALKLETPGVGRRPTLYSVVQPSLRL